MSDYLSREMLRLDFSMKINSLVLYHRLRTLFTAS